ncbi:MAG: AraC family transcriptional regulator [Acidobacteriota bacterium]|nr:AraC family transcriptional regulator [Acidobacteriota bacterium]
MPLEVRIKPVETLLFRGEMVAVGKFRCLSTHPLFRDSGPCSHHTIVFPRTMTRIRHDNGTSFLGNPGFIGLLNMDQQYTRARVSEIDASDWYTVADDVLLEMLREIDPRSTQERPFRIPNGPSDARSFAEQRILFTALERGDALDANGVEESVLRFLARALGCAYRGQSRAWKPLRPAEIDAVEHAQQLIAIDPASNIPLRVLADACGLSPFQLCRLFRLRTGDTITAHRHALRLRLALERLRDARGDLTGIALDLGYSSHSHFTFAFRRHFGFAPSAFLRAIA